MTKTLSVWRENGRWLRLRPSTRTPWLMVEMFDEAHRKWEFHEYVVPVESDLTAEGCDY